MKLNRISNLYSELRRRNVTKALLLYVGIAWAIIGALDILLPILGASDDLMQVAIVVALVGLFITGVTSWFFELTENGWVRESLRNSAVAPEDASWFQSRTVDYVIIGSLAAALALSLYNNAESTEEIDRTRTLAEIENLLTQDRYVDAYAKISKLDGYGVDEAEIELLMASTTAQVGLETEPAGALVHYRALVGESIGEWVHLGSSPVKDVRIPKGIFELRFQKEGFVEVRRIERNPGFLLRSRDTAEIGIPSFKPELSVRLPQRTNRMVESVNIPGGSTFTTPYFGMGLATKAVGEFAISKFEVSNQQFMQFVDAGGYESDTHWHSEFVKDGESLDFEQAMRHFVDTTGRPGPSSWSYGKFTEGVDHDPVSGLSWYEARAYANFVGGDLPSVYQFGRAAYSANEVNAPLRPLMIKRSNFSGDGVSSTKSQKALGPYGTFDMLGNVREWTINGEGDKNLKFILGGSWKGPSYSTMSANRVDPWNRSAANGVRVVFNPSGALVDRSPINTFSELSIDHMTSPTNSDEEFSAFQWAFQSINAALNTRVEDIQTHQHWTRKQISIAVGTGEERMSIYLYLPHEIQKPYQPIILFPGYTAFAPGALSKDSVDTEFPFPDFVIKGGRALVFPVVAGAYERYDGQLALNTDERRKNQIARRMSWVKEIGRVIDYLEKDEQFDASQVGYLGISFGASRPMPVLAMEKRLKAAILLSGGISFYDYDDAIPPIGKVMNYVTRTTLPVLMINGRYDNVLAPERQKPLFERLATPAAHKKWVVYDTGHWPYPENQMISEVLGWMDEYLGAVQ